MTDQGLGRRPLEDAQTAEDLHRFLNRLERSLSRAWLGDRFFNSIPRVKTKNGPRTPRPLLQATRSLRMSGAN